MVCNWSLCDSKSPQVSKTLLSILAILNHTAIWMVSTRPPTSKSSSPFKNPLVTVPTAPITICIIVTFMFHKFFNSQFSISRLSYLSFFSHSFSFILWSAGITIIIIIIINISSFVWEFFSPTPPYADGFSVEFQWQEIFSRHQDSSNYSAGS